jgi:hypothetical protein
MLLIYKIKKERGKQIMAKVKIFVVTDHYGSIQYIGCKRQDAIDEAIEWDIIPNFEGWVDEWMSNNEGVDLLELLDKKEPKVALRDQYFESIEEDIENNEYQGFEIYEVDIPLDAVEFGKELPPEILAVVINIFNC